MNYLNWNCTNAQLKFKTTDSDAYFTFVKSAIYESVVKIEKLQNGEYEETKRNVTLIHNFCIGSEFNYFVKDHAYMTSELDKAFNSGDNRQDPTQITRDEVYTFHGRNMLMYRAFNIQNIKSGCVYDFKIIS